MADNPKPTGTARPERPGKGESAEYAYRVLRDEIMSLHFAPGSSLDEAKVVRELGISRTPLREAVVRLAGEGLIRLLPNRGVRVAPMEWGWAAARRTEADLKEIRAHCQSFRAAAEKQDDRAMANLNWDFHARIAHSIRNRSLERFYLQQLTENLRISHLAMATRFYGSGDEYQAHVTLILDEHDAIVEAIAAQDCDLAERLARSHTGLAKKRVVEVLTQSVSDSMQISLADDELKGVSHV